MPSQSQSHPPGDRSPFLVLGDAWVAAFGAWTLACNAVVHGGGGLETLAWVGPPAAVCGAALAWRWGGGSAAADDTAGTSRGTSVRVVGFLGAAAVSIAASLGASTVLVWSAALAILLVGWLGSRSGGAGAPCVPTPPWLWALALAAVALPLLVHRGSPDDSFYVNVAVHAVDEPGEALLSRDGMHGADLPLLSAVYRVHSFELLGALASRASGVPAVRVMHHGLSALVGLLSVLAIARLARLLAPRYWPVVTLVAIAALWMEGEIPQSIGTFATLRLQQGKTMLAIVCLPFVLERAVLFARCPSRGGLVMLFLAQVGAVGASSTGLWAAPVVAAFGLVAGASGSLKSLLRASSGLFASSHAIGLGLMYAVQARTEVALDGARQVGVQLVRRNAGAITDGDALVREAWATVMGSGAFSVAALFGLLGGWTLLGSARARRIAIVPVLGTLVFALDPWTAFFVAENVSGGPTFWRVLWLMPVHAIMAAGLVTALARLPRVGKHPAGVALLGLACFGALTGARGLTDGVRWSPLAIKASRLAYPHAEALVGGTPGGAAVLAPRLVAPWVVTFHDHPYPLVVRQNFMAILAPHFDRGDLDRRLRLWRLATGIPVPNEGAFLEAAIRDYDLRGITFARNPSNMFRMPILLEQNGFARILADSEYETWVRYTTRSR